MRDRSLDANDDVDNLNHDRMDEPRCDEHLDILFDVDNGCVGLVDDGRRTVSDRGDGTQPLVAERMQHIAPRCFPASTGTSNP
jgi:hypothetical protein